ncbi:MAG TPA: YmdB family metallophosphoesterase, partial [Candidatus Polarisedimenticolia bacterium]|nr:YmdB family metallophosphoesterase [Candidatus Polarisedimenticolia bacterium]
KMALGWYLDGRISALVGTHTHVQTSDEQILPKGTGYLTDAGMTGPHDSVIGVQKELAIRKFLTQLPTRFEPATGNVKLHGVHMDFDEATGRCLHVERVAMSLDARAPVTGVS